MHKKLFYIAFLVLVATVKCASQRRELKATLYPFIPNADNYYRKLEKDFELANPLINLIINLNYDYYDDEIGILSEQADVYEIDCIFLSDFIKKSKIKPLSTSAFNTADILPAANIVFQGGKLFGVPHWLCGNFLFFDKRDSIFKKVNRLSDLEEVIGKNPTLSNGLLIDIKGKTTVGELYGDAVLDEHLTEANLIKYINLNSIDPIAIQNLNRLLPLTYTNWGRIDQYHNRTGFYQRQFAKGNGRAFVGYSESLYYINDEINNGHLEESFLKTDNIEVSHFSLSDKGSTPIGWVDMLSINDSVTGQKLLDAQNFIQFVISTNGYHLALIPDFGDAPRYLLPTYKAMYNDPLVLKNAPLYSKFLELVASFKTVTASNLGQNFRALGRKIDKDLLRN